MHQVVHGGVGVVDEVAHGVAHLVEVVRRDVGGHAHGDAGRAVDQQVGEARRQHRRLLEAVVEVGHEIDRFFVDVEQHLLGDFGQAALGVTHGGGGVVVHRAEVALSVDERVAHGKVLRHAHHGVVNGGVAVRVVFAQHVAHHAGALLVGGCCASAPARACRKGCGGAPA